MTVPVVPPSAGARAAGALVQPGTCVHFRPTAIWPRHPLCQDGSAGAGLRCALDGHRDVPVDGDDVLVVAGGDHSDADDRAMGCGKASRPHRVTLRPKMLVLSHIPCPLWYDGRAE